MSKDPNYDWAGYAKAWRSRHPERDRQSRQDWKRNNPSGYVFHKARSRAKHKGLEFTLTPEWVAEHMAAGVCEKTGLIFDMALGSAAEANPLTPTIDREDHTKGYTPENCRVVCWIYNCAKGPWTDEDVRKLSVAIIGQWLYDNHPEQLLEGAIQLKDEEDRKRRMN